jgi:SP family facilitated glucose transporter-like MFS transporter 3
MTFPPIFLIDVSFIRQFLSNYRTWSQRVGRRQLLLTSVIGALASLALTGYGLNTGMMVTSSVSIVTFVMQALPLPFFMSCLIYFCRSFAVGLGPVPFVIVSEVAPPHVRTSSFCRCTKLLRYGLGRFSPFICCSLVELYGLGTLLFGTLY